MLAEHLLALSSQLGQFSGKLSSYGLSTAPTEDTTPNTNTPI